MSDLQPDTVSPRSSKAMRAIQSRDTKPEIALRRELQRRGLRGYRVAPSNLPGSPDVTFPGVRLAIFVDGCFFHGCPQHCRLPNTNTAYWHPKIARTMERDCENTAELQSLGWTVHRLWEHQLRTDLAVSIDRISELIDHLRRLEPKSTLRTDTPNP